MTLLRKCSLLFVLWGAIFLVVGAAPTAEPLAKASASSNDKTESEDDPDVIARKQRDLIGCYSTIKGYGLCDEYMFPTDSRGSYQPTYVPNLTPETPPSTVYQQQPYPYGYSDYIVNTIPEQTGQRSFETADAFRLDPQRIIADQVVIVNSETNGSPAQKLAYPSNIPPYSKMPSPTEAPVVQYVYYANPTTPIAPITPTATPTPIDLYELANKILPYLKATPAPPQVSLQPIPPPVATSTEGQTTTPVPTAFVPTTTKVPATTAKTVEKNEADSIEKLTKLFQDYVSSHVSAPKQNSDITKLTTIISNFSNFIANINPEDFDLPETTAENDVLTRTSTDIRSLQSLLHQLNVIAQNLSNAFSAIMKGQDKGSSTKNGDSNLTTNSDDLNDLLSAVSDLQKRMEAFIKKVSSKIDKKTSPEKKPKKEKQKQDISKHRQDPSSSSDERLNILLEAVEALKEEVDKQNKNSLANNDVKKRKPGDGVSKDQKKKEDVVEHNRNKLDKPDPQPLLDQVKSSMNELKDTMSQEIKELGNALKDVIKAKDASGSSSQKRALVPHVEGLLKSFSLVIDQGAQNPPDKIELVDISEVPESFDELNDKALINRLIEIVYNIVAEGIEDQTLQEVTKLVANNKKNGNSYDDGLTKTINSTLQGTKFTEIKPQPSNVRALNNTLSDFIDKYYPIAKNVSSTVISDLSKTIENVAKQGSKTYDSKVISDKIENIKTSTSVSTKDVEILSQDIESLLKQSVSTDEISHLAKAVETLENNSNKTNGAYVEKDTIIIRVASKKVREYFQNFTKTIDFIYKNTDLLEKHVDDLDTSVHDLVKIGKNITKIEEIHDISNKLFVSNNEKKTKREIANKEGIAEELYPVIYDAIKSNFSEPSIEAYLEKVRELTLAGREVPDIITSVIDDVFDIVFSEVRRRRDVKDVIEVPKNELYDVIEEAFKSHFTDASLQAYGQKVDELATKGADPYDIIGRTLSSMFLIAVQESPKTDEESGRSLPVDNSELYHLVDEAMRSNLSDVSMDAYGDKVDELLMNGVNPVRIMVDVIADVIISALNDSVGEELLA